jgi:transposase-like protein
MKVTLRYNSASVQVMDAKTGEILYQGSGLLSLLIWIRQNDIQVTKVTYPPCKRPQQRLRLGAHRLP